MLSTLVSALLLVVTLTGVLPYVASSRGHVGVLSDGSPGDHLRMMERFHGWMAKHGRSYPTVEEKLRRFDIYHRNVMFIEAANLDGRLTYTLGENQFTDLTHEEFLAKHTSRPVAPSDLVRNEEETVITTRAGVVEEVKCKAAPDNVPHSINWADLGKVTEVKDQGEICGACWAFAAVATIESAYAIAKGVEPPVLSEQELIDCDQFDDGCRVGLMSNAYQWVQRNGGIANASTYPYHERLQTSQNKEKDGTCEEAKLREHAVTIRRYKYVTGNCEQQLMAAVAARPVAVLFDAHNYCFQHYKTGVYNGMCFDDDGELVGPCTSDHLTHSMAIVGYSGKGDDEEKYWIAKNSWGDTWWGEQGYVRLKKDVADPRGLCGLAIEPVYPLV
ncbi:macrodontain-1-like [Lolium rigidum]|uniref:macrodontain-1-like n=1 Tax=Lolium rigidum TaxID=89674 RepID=UPI001F5C188D|nr:macrodontain-1-like [Lolium rigidum]